MRQAKGFWHTTHILEGNSAFRISDSNNSELPRFKPQLSKPQIMSAQQLNEIDIDRVIEMAWEDRTPFSAIEFQFGLKEQEVIELMRKEMKRSSFKMWRARVQGRKTKHTALRSDEVNRHRCSRQRAISGNKISKR